MADGLRMQLCHTERNDEPKNPADDRRDRRCRRLRGARRPSPADTFTYTLPSPPSAVYQIADTMVGRRGHAPGGIAITAEATVTMGLAFATDPGGVRVTGTVEAFAASMTNPMMGTETADADDLSGNLEAVISRHGVKEQVSFPEPLVQSVRCLPFRSSPTFSPRLPDGDVDPGATWVDTVNASYDGEEISITTTTISTYTLVGDTLVEGRGLVHIAVENEVTTDLVIEEGGITQNVAGPASGFVLWDPERRLVAYVEYERDVGGTTRLPGMPPMNVSISGRRGYGWRVKTHLNHREEK